MDASVIELKTRGRRRVACAPRPAADAAAVVVPWAAAFDALPVAALVIGPDGRLVARNGAARALLGVLAEPGIACCDLLGCGYPGTSLEGDCVGRAGAARGITDIPMAIGDGVLLTAVPAGDAGDVVVLLRPAASGAAAEEREGGMLHVSVLGRTAVVGDEEVLGGDWLGHKPGQLLKYLLLARGRVVAVEELLEALWPGAGRAGATSVRQAVHTLRDRLEPGRTRGEETSFVRSVRGGYQLDVRRIVLDVDGFEAAARTGLDALRRGDDATAVTQLTAAAAAYAGDLLVDEPYAEWTLAERERLRDLAAQVLRALAAERDAAGDLDAAAGHLQRLAELDPLDLDAQRSLLGLMLRRGRHSEALRRYDLVRRRYRRTFGEDPGFALSELVAA
jgi:DNA-binding SARP family transcriptional activator